MSCHADGSALRVRFVVHHERNPDAGVAGATLALAAALEQTGECRPSFFWLDDACPGGGVSEVARWLRFPWVVARHLSERGAAFDVVDATAGDAWVWATLGRPRHRCAALVARSHGLEHTAALELRRRAARGEHRLSRRYGIYHGGYRLWEVARALRLSDAQLFLNSEDRDLAVDRLGVSPSHALVVPNGVADDLLQQRDAAPPAEEGAPLRLVFLGGWIPRKGIAALVTTATALHARGVRFTLHLLGTGVPAPDVLAVFPSEVRPALTVTPQYARAELPRLLADGRSEIVLHLSWSEGYGLALTEAMACGAAPVAVRTGIATTFVDGVEAVLVDGPDQAAEAIANLAVDRDRLLRLRCAAQRRARQFRWRDVALHTLGVYREALARRREGSR